MFSFAKKKRTDQRPIYNAYHALVAQARDSVFYEDYDVPDTLEGRFDMVVLHLVLVIRGLRRTRPGNVMAQALFDLFVSDMDQALRAMGVGDTKVPRKMKAIGQAFYGRAARYEEALNAGDADAMSPALARNVFEADAPSAFSRRLALYALAGDRSIQGQDEGALLTGRPAFPDPRSVAHD